MELINRIENLHELENDHNMLSILQTNQFTHKLDVLEKDIEHAILSKDSTQLTVEEQIKLDIYLTYVNTTLFWIFLKLQGVELSKHYILHDLVRAKEILAREKEVDDAAIITRLDLGATKRFIAAGLHSRFVDMDGVMVTEDQYKKSL